MLLPSEPALDEAYRAEWVGTPPGPPPPPGTGMPDLPMLPLRDPAFVAAGAVAGGATPGPGAAPASWRFEADPLWSFLC